MIARTLEFLLVLTRVMKEMGTMTKNTFFRLTFVVTHLLGSYVVASEESVSVGTKPLQDVCPGLHQTTDINVLGASFVFVGLCCVLLGCVQMRTRSKNRLHVTILLHDISVKESEITTLKGTIEQSQKQKVRTEKSLAQKLRVLREEKTALSETERKLSEMRPLFNSRDTYAGSSQSGDGMDSGVGVDRL